MKINNDQQIKESISRTKTGWILKRMFILWPQLEEAIDRLVNEIGADVPLYLENGTHTLLDACIVGAAKSVEEFSIIFGIKDSSRYLFLSISGLIEPLKCLSAVQVCDVEGNYWNANEISYRRWKEGRDTEPQFKQASTPNRSFYELEKRVVGELVEEYEEIEKWLAKRNHSHI